jgi:hypothetical protein
LLVCHISKAIDSKDCRGAINTVFAGTAPRQNRFIYNIFCCADKTENLDRNNLNTGVETTTGVLAIIYRYD